MRRWLLVLLAIMSLPMALWLLFAAVVWLGGDWETASYALGWTFNVAVLGAGYLVAIITSFALVVAAIRSAQDGRARKRGWR